MQELWTIQQFSTVAGQHWYALQRHNDAGVEFQFTGYRHEIDAFIRKHHIEAEELPEISEDEFLQRGFAQSQEYGVAA